MGSTSFLGSKEQQGSPASFGLPAEARTQVVGVRRWLLESEFAGNPVGKLDPVVDHLSARAQFVDLHPLMRQFTYKTQSPILREVGFRQVAAFTWFLYPKRNDASAF